MEKKDEEKCGLAFVIVFCFGLIAKVINNNFVWAAMVVISIFVIYFLAMRPAFRAAREDRAKKEAEKRVREARRIAGQIG